ncbi:MAG: hypothetical protein ACYDD1_11280 [Caulobacteraceae bacterium]
MMFNARRSATARVADPGSKRESHWLLSVAAVLIVVSGASSAMEQWRHDKIAHHSDMRWIDMQARFTKVEHACRLSEAP